MNSTSPTDEKTPTKTHPTHHIHHVAQPPIPDTINEDETATATSPAPTQYLSSKPHPMNLTNLAAALGTSPDRDSIVSAVSTTSPQRLDPTHTDTLGDVLERNRAWSVRQQKKNPGMFEKLALKQSPEILWIGCCDSRVPAENICGFGPGDLFVHRNIANVVVHTDLSMLSVLQYAVDILKVKHIIVCGHYKCGGCNSAMSQRQFGLIDNWLRNIKDIYAANAAQLDPLPEEERQDVLVELNVAKSVLNVCHTTIVQNAWARGQYLSVHGWVYRLSDGLLEDLQLCINHREEVTSVYTYVTNTGIPTAKRRNTSIDRLQQHQFPLKSPLQTYLAASSNCASPKEERPVSAPAHGRNSLNGGTGAQTPTGLASRMNVIPYKQPRVSADDADPDFFGLISLLGAFGGLVFRQKYAVWVSLCAALISQLTAKQTEKEHRQGSGTIAFTLMGVVMLYTQLLLKATNDAIVAEKEMQMQN
ncbi:hypothetical protein HDU98_004205 [Podochytrium sp. JEL0797]|nr:hypothetical protein HDU98_004205 [Podochytrium sp. JEL0797]